MKMVMVMMMMGCGSNGTESMQAPCCQHAADGEVPLIECDYDRTQPRAVDPRAPQAYGDKRYYETAADYRLGVHRVCGGGQECNQTGLYCWVGGDGG